MTARSRLVVVLPWIVLSATSCGDGPAAPATATVQITTATTGHEIDADGYTVEVGESSRPIGVNTTVTFEVTAGTVQATLGGLAFNCEVDGENPMDITVNGGETVEARFDVTCAKPQLAFASDRQGLDDVYLMNSDGTEVRNLTNSPGWLDQDPSWSPDGERLSFTTDRDGRDRFCPDLLSNCEIYAMNADGSGAVNVSNRAGSNEWTSAWSPDGTRIAFTTHRDGSTDVYVMNTDGTDQVNLSDSPGIDGSPSWSPDGTRLAFVSERDRGNAEIYIMNADGSDQVNVSNRPVTLDFLPAWSPDGTRIAFSSRPDIFSKADIYVMSADGTDQVNVSSRPASNDFFPAWSPDGRRIAFVSDRDGNEEIYIMNADGTDQVNISNQPGRDRWPAWRP